MSQRALAVAVRDEIIETFSYTREQCDVAEPPGVPPAVCGELFVAVWEGGVTNNATESRDDIHSINVTLSKRTGFTPSDRQSDVAAHEDVIGLEVLADKVASLVHDNNAIRARANSLISRVSGTLTVYGFGEVLRYLGMSTTQNKGGEWFRGDPKQANTGIALTIRFGKARRLQSNSRQT